MAALRPETAIRKLIVDDATLGATLGTRVYPGAAPQGADYPLGVFERDATTPHHHMGGVSTLKYARATFTWYGDNPTTLYTMGEDVEALLDGGRMTVTIGADSITFDTLHLESQQDQMLAQQDGTGRAVYQIMQTYFVAYQNS